MKATHDRKLVSQSYVSFRSLISLSLGDGSCAKFWEDIRVGSFSYTLSTLHRNSGNTLFIQTSVINGTWWKAKILPYKQAIAAYDAAIAGLPSQIAYGGWQKICHAIPPWPFNYIGSNTLLLTKIY